ncbi:MAG: DUF1549 and DUF1553 domain-containing protein [Gemmataceae bacterium]
MMRKILPLLAFLAFARPLGADEPVVVQEPAIKPSQRQHWAFRPPIRPAIPAVHAASWLRTPIDAFILAKLEAAGLKPAPEADRLTLLRRVTVDLTGLPPMPEDQDAFLQDQRPDAYEQLVERLLSSPHYGERWAQHWLDVVRYAESNGYEADAERPHAWRYRDYVIRSFNSDKPFRQFVVEQLAGDLGAQADPKVGMDAWIATGLHRCGPMHFVGGNSDAEVSRQEILTEMVNGVGSAFLGLTVGCARCHDHKFDPVSAADYYRLQAFFAATQLTNHELATAEEKAAYAKAVATVQAKIAPLKAKVAALEGPVQARLGEEKKAGLEPKYRDALAVPAAKRSPEQKLLAEQAGVLVKVTWDEIIAALTPADRLQRQGWRNEIHALEAQLPSPPAEAWAVADGVKIPSTFVLRRGDTKRKDGEVVPAFPRILAFPTNAEKDKRLTRLDLANWLASPQHPLTGRVWVNRLWQHHFGHGLVASANDFGFRGELPTHPELLDWLAIEFSRTGGSTKAMHRLMVLSATYRQASRAPASTVDPENQLLARMNRRRKESETLRDSILAVAGTLNRQLGGPPVRVPLEPEVYDLIFTEGEPDGLWNVTPDERQRTRRSVYLFAKRNVRQPLLEAFDQPDTLNSCPVRPVSTFAPQALILMNGPLAQAQSKKLAVRLLREAGGSADAVIDRGYRLALGRPPRPTERAIAGDFLRRQNDLLRERLRGRLPVGLPEGAPEGVDPAFAAAVADFALALLNLNEFIYVD